MAENICVGGRCCSDLKTFRQTSGSRPEGCWWVNDPSDIAKQTAPLHSFNDEGSPFRAGKNVKVLGLKSTRLRVLDSSWKVFGGFGFGLGSGMFGV